MTTCDFAQIVCQHYEPLYRFALSLTRAEPDAMDLTQQTFHIWAVKGHQLRDVSKVKSWLYTTLYREFLRLRKQCSRVEYFELGDDDQNIPDFSTEMVNSLDAARVIELLQHVNEPYRSAVSLFYMEDLSYKEIAGILEVPVGTVQSRISRGIGQLQRLMCRVDRIGQHRSSPGSGTAKLESGMQDATIPRRDFGGQGIHNLV